MMVKTLKLLGIDVFLEDEELLNKTKVGMADCLYKREHGYVGYSIGEIEERYTNFDLEEWVIDWKNTYSITI